MEKLSTTFLELTQNYEVMLWFWTIITIPASTWHFFSFPSKKQLTEKELVKISPDHAGINTKYMAFSILWVFVMIFILVIQGAKLDNWVLQNYGIRFYPLGVMFNAGYGIYQATFAIISGLYPCGKQLAYIYDETQKLKTFAVRQISISIALVLLSTTFFFITNN